MPENARTPSKSSQVAPAHSASHTPRRIDEHIAESKLNLKPKALASEQIFPTLECLAEEQGLDIEHQAREALSEDTAHLPSAANELAPSAWQGKLPEAVKQDGEFTQAEIIFVDEPAERAAELAKKEEEKAVHHALPLTDVIPNNNATELAPSAWQGILPEPVQEKGESLEVEKNVDTTEHITKKKKKSHHKKKNHSESVPEPSKPAPHSVDIAPHHIDEPIAESKLNLKPKALQSEEIFPTLESIAVEQGLEVEHHAWQGKIPEAVKEDGEFTQAEVKFVDEVAERAAELAKKNKDRKEHRQALAEIERVKKASEVVPEPVAESIPDQQADDLAEEQTVPTLQVLASKEVFPTLESLTEEQGLEVEHHAWQGKIPEVVKQDAEFTQAKVNFIDEPAQRAAELAKKKQERKELRQALAEIERVKKASEVAPTNVSEPVAESMDQQPEDPEYLDEEAEDLDEEQTAPTLEVLASKEVFPTLESLTEEQGLEVEHHAWQGKIPEVVKQDAEFTQAKVNFIDEPAQRAAELAKKKQERKELRQALAEIERVKKASEVAPTNVSEPVAESMPDNQPDESKDLAEEQTAPTPESLPNEQVPDESSPAQARELALAPSAWEANEALVDNTADKVSPSEPTQIDGSSDEADDEFMDEPAEPAPVIALNDVPQRKESHQDLQTRPQPSETFIERFVVGLASVILVFNVSIVCGVLRILGVRDVAGRLVMGSRNAVGSIIEGTPLRNLRSIGNQFWTYRLAVRMVSTVDSNVRAQIESKPAEKALAVDKREHFLQGSRKAPVSGSTSALPEARASHDPRETSFEQLIIGSASSILILYLSIVCGFLRIFGLRDLAGRVVMGLRTFGEDVIEGSFLRHIQSYGNKWLMYRLAARVIRNVDREVKKQLGTESGKKEVHFEEREIALLNQ